MMQKGFKQREVAERLGLTQQMVSYRWGIIKTQYPELLQKNEEILQTNLPNDYKNTNDTKNTKDTKICEICEFVEGDETSKIDEVPPQTKPEFVF
jgi:transcriptional regulator with XRE-family HTH domain